MKVIFIPGNGGGETTENFFPYLKGEFEKMGFQVLTPKYPDSYLARQKYWLPFIEKLGTDENTILVGHSSGAIAAMRYAETHKIKGSVLISGYHTNLGVLMEKISGYFKKPWDWEAIKRNQDFIIQFNSTDDPFIPIHEAHFVHEKLNSDYYEMNSGHFYPQNTFPEVAQAVRKNLK